MTFLSGSAILPEMIVLGRSGYRIESIRSSGMTNRTIFFRILVFIFCAIPAFPVTFQQDSQWTLSLNSDWKFALADSSQKDLLQTFYGVDFDDSGWKPIPVPSNWELEGFEQPRYVSPDPEKTGLYRKSFMLPSSWDGRQVMIDFEGVSFGYTLYVNGKEIGSFEHAFLPCQFDITRQIRKGENLIALKVYRDHPQIEFDCNDAWALSGIYRDVTVFSPPRFFIDNLVIDTRINVRRQFADIVGGLDVRYFRHGEGLKPPLPKLALTMELLDPDGRSIAAQSETIPFENPDFFPHHSFRIPVENAVFWNAEHPALYELILTLQAGDQEPHVVRQKVGLRQVTIADRIFRINGSPVKLRGACRHEIHPDVGRALRERHWRQDIEMMKAANMNAVRCSHYPPHPRFLELCDEAGLYVLDEVPIGFGDHLLDDPSLLGAMLSRAELTVRRDRNHPSVIIWAAGNENPLTANLEKTAAYVKQLDPSRPVYYPGGNFYGSHPQADTGHAAFIDFYSRHYPGLEHMERHRDNLTIPVPILYTELNHALDTAFGDFAAKWELIEQTDRMAGAMIWLWADQGIRRSINGRPVHNSYKNIHDLGPSDLSGDVRIDDNTILDSHGQYGTDGIVYADRRPQTDYFQTRRVYSPVVVHQTEVGIQPGVQMIELTVENRYDFTDLSRLQAKCTTYINRKAVNQGVLNIPCPPHEKQIFQLPVDLPDTCAESDCRLELEFMDGSGKTVAEHTVRLIPETGKPDWFLLSEKGMNSAGKIRESADGWRFPGPAGPVLRLDQKGLMVLKTAEGKVRLEGPFVRVGRKPTMAERRMYETAKLEIWEPAVFRQGQVLKSSKSQKDNQTILELQMRIQSPDRTKTVQADLRYTLDPRGWIDVDYSLEPETREGALLEFGLAFEIPKSADQVSWLGLGPYPSFPQKSELCRRGIYTLWPEDPFFAGNRMGVDLAVFEETGQNGIGFVCSEDNLAWEKSEEATIISHNLLVAGLGTKFRMPKTMFDAQNSQRAEGRFRILFLNQGNWPMLFEELFHLNPRD